MEQYKRLLSLIEGYIKNRVCIEVSQRFCEEFMDTFYAAQESLEKEVSEDIYEIFDDLNLICDSYEPNEKIREADKYCIDEIVLKNKVNKIYKLLMEKTKETR